MEAALMCRSCGKQILQQILNNAKFGRVIAPSVSKRKLLQKLKAIPSPTLFDRNKFSVRSAGLVGVNTHHTVCGECTTTPHGPVVINLTFEDVLYGLEHNKVHMLDVRHHYEVETTGRIGDANILPLQEIEDALQLSNEEFQMKYGFEKSYLKSDNLVIYCQTGRRALVASGILLSHGYTGVKRYAGSWNEWDDRIDDYDDGPMVAHGHS